LHPDRKAPKRLPIWFIERLRERYTAVEVVTEAEHGVATGGVTTRVRATLLDARGFSHGVFAVQVHGPRNLRFTGKRVNSIWRYVTRGNFVRATTIRDAG